MCGIFGAIADVKGTSKYLRILAEHATQRGRDSSGLIFQQGRICHVKRANYNVKSLLAKTKPYSSSFVFGHSRLITNGLADNQPVIRNDILVIHNGIIVNDTQIWRTLKAKRHLKVDTEIIAAIAELHIQEGNDLHSLASAVLERCKGTISTVVVVPKLGKAILFSNNGSLYFGSNDEGSFFSSESYPLEKINCENIKQIYQDAQVVDLPACPEIQVSDHGERKADLIPDFKFIKSEANLLEYREPQFTRCTKCILPETMPYIKFDEKGVCNFCHSYKSRNQPKPVKELIELLEPFRRTHGNDCIVPFSGGRDSCYGLHLIATELKMKPITYTYDWGMVTDLGRRNISRMSAALGVENLIIADNIPLKRRNIAMNFKAWLKSPHLGMVSILTAGDKHFFRHVETVKKQTGISLNLWGVNPLEVTHFKAGFLGVPPDFSEEKVYSNGAMKQFQYQWLRLRAMSQSLGYFNSSLWDTVSGEYYRSYNEKTDYHHIFDYWRWNEKTVNDTLINEYDWETALDTTTTWRIGDGTAAIYNYIYHTVAGFTEHDTFRSNQIREGDLDREQALVLVQEENRPRYPNIKWYLDAIEMEFDKVIPIINAIPKLYKE